MTEAGASVPNLRAKQPIFRLVFVLGAVALIGVIVAIVLLRREAKDPGRAACDRIAQLAEKDPEDWREFVEALIGFLQSRTIDKDDDTKRIVITAKGADERCREVFGAIHDSMPYTRFKKLVDCMSAIDTREGARDCFAAAYPKD